MYIYKITNILNNKVYIGQTIRPVEQRFKRHINDAINNKLNTHFANAIRKYGKENFTIEIIDSADKQWVLDNLEQYWIIYYNSTDPNYGYNESYAGCKCGGNTYISKTEDEMNVIKDKIRQTKLGSNNPHSRAVKCFNVNTNQELVFDTAKVCMLWFNQKHHRFITTRVLGQVKGLFQNEWKIAYADSDYGTFYPRYYNHHS